MECISSERKMSIEYSNLSVGIATAGPQLLCEVEGILKVRFDDEEFLSEEGILLLELAKELCGWLKKSCNFSYYSMDYEDGPILSFKKVGEFWEVSSIWSEHVYNGVNLFTIISEVELFISKLFLDLNMRNIDTSSFIS